MSEFPTALHLLILGFMKTLGCCILIQLVFSFEAVAMRTDSFRQSRYVEDDRELQLRDNAVQEFAELRNSLIRLGNADINSVAFNCPSIISHAARLQDFSKWLQEGNDDNLTLPDPDTSSEARKLANDLYKNSNRDENPTAPVIKKTRESARCKKLVGDIAAKFIKYSGLYDYLANRASNPPPTNRPAAVPPPKGGATG